MQDTESEAVKNMLFILNEEYELGDEELDSLYKKWVERFKSSPTSCKETSKFSANDLKHLKKPELQQLCKSKNLHVTGTREVLINRILGLAEVPVKKRSSGKKKTLALPSVLQKLTVNKEMYNIRRNVFGNYEHPETSLVFDSISQKVIGRQLNDERGSVAPLTVDDIEQCEIYGFSYIFPSNLE